MDSTNQAQARARERALVEALAATSSGARGAPPGFGAFVRTLAEGARAPDFTEHSVRFSARDSGLHVHRLTHYFDVARAPGGTAHALGAVLLGLCHAAGAPASPALERLVLERLPAAPGLAQVVLGIDARHDATTRLKYYAVFDRPSAEVVETARESLGVRPMPGLEPAEVRIVGFDLGAAGLDDLKVYMKLDTRRLARTVRNYDEVAELTALSREVVLQQCLVQPERRQFHFHAGDSRHYAAWLAERAPTNPGIAACLAHARRLEAHLGGVSLLPAIVGFEHRAGRLETDHGNIYFHVEDVRGRPLGPEPRR